MKFQSFFLQVLCACILVFVYGLVSHAPALFAQTATLPPRPLFKSVPTPPDHVKLPESAKAGTGRFVDVNMGVLQGETFVLNFSDGLTLIAEREQLIDREAGNFIWSGRIQDEPNSQVTIALRNGVVGGSIRRNDTIYEIRAVNVGTYALFEIDEDALPPHGFSMAPPADELRALAAESSDAESLAAVSAAGIDNVSVIDLMVVYTPAARDSNGQASLESQIVAAVHNTNVAYQNSNVNIQINLVHMSVIDYAETGGISQSLVSLRSSTDGIMDEVHTWRNNYGADMVSLITGDSSGCGIAYVMTSLSSGYERYAFSVVERNCLSNRTLAHELGHNQGNYHDRANSLDSSGNLLSGVDPYSYGYRVCGEFRTIMSYYCTGAYRIDHFANPNISWNNMPTGIDHNTDPNNSADAAQTLNNTAALVASFRDTISVNPPSAPTGLAATAVSASQIDLVWTDAATLETGFQIERSTDGATWSQIAIVGANITAYSDTGLSASTAYQYRVYAFNNAGNSANTNVATATTMELPPYIDSVADGQTIGSGAVNGSYNETHTDNDSPQSITEVSSGGKPANRYSYLEHTWTFNVVGGDVVTLSANAYSGGSADDDSFVFAYAANGNAYQDMFTVESTDSGNMALFTLPAETSGPVSVRVQDTNRTAGNNQIDTIYVDHIYIRSAAPAKEAPSAPTDLIATASSDSQIDLAWVDTADNESGFTIERQNGDTWTQVTTTGANVQAYTDSGLDATTTYTYRVFAINAAGVSVYSPSASATTEEAPLAMEMHVGDLTGSTSEGNRNRWNALVTITVHDSDHNVVTDATVAGDWSGGAKGSSTCTTDLSGQCTVTAENLKSNVSEATFTISDVTHSLYTYAEENNHTLNPNGSGTVITVAQSSVRDVFISEDGAGQSTTLYLPFTTR